MIWSVYLYDLISIWFDQYICMIWSVYDLISIFVWFDQYMIWSVYLYDLISILVWFGHDGQCICLTWSIWFLPLYNLYKFFTSTASYFWNSEQGTSCSEPRSLGHEREAVVPGHPDPRLGDCLLCSTKNSRRRSTEVNFSYLSTIYTKTSDHLRSKTHTHTDTILRPVIRGRIPGELQANLGHHVSPTIFTANSKTAK